MAITLDSTVLYDRNASNHTAAAIIAKDEGGYRPDIYRDTKGKRTTGIGFNIDDPVMASFLHPDVVAGKRGPTPQEAQVAFGKRLELAKNDVLGFIGPDFYSKQVPARQNALLNMSYQMGGTSLRGFHKVKRALLQGDTAAAADEILRSDYAIKDTPERAYRQAYSMLTGVPYEENMVKRFQATAGLKPDGIVGPKTWKVLRGVYAKRK